MVAATEGFGRVHSVPRPAFGVAMLTLLRVRREARLRRRPELDGASRPLHRAGSWQPSLSCRRKAGALLSSTVSDLCRGWLQPTVGRIQTTNLGVGSSNPVGRATSGQWFPWKRTFMRVACCLR